MALQTSDKPICWTIVLQFYFRRIRRIVPIYLVSVMLSLLFAPSLLFRYDIQQLLKDVVPAVTLTSNMNFLAADPDGGYFLEVPASENGQRPYLLFTGAKQDPSASPHLVTVR